MERRKPRGYLGRDHQTIGSDILSVFRSLTFPRNILGDEVVSSLEKVKESEWYPIEILLDLMDRLEAKLGEAGLRKLGRTLFKTSHEERVKSVILSARDVVYGIDGMYRHANRGGGIGGWKVERFAPGDAVLEKTTPHHCVMEEGILLEALNMLKVTAKIEQSKCFRRGDDVCLLSISSMEKGKSWVG